jgi:methanogenic corrinoid protein MtbC1
MTFTSIVGRSQLAEKVTGAGDFISQAVSDDLYLKHPEWQKSYGDPGHKFCRDDIRLHIQFLAGAIEAGSLDAFADYARWTTRMLGARGIIGDSLRETFSHMAKQLNLVLSVEESVLVSSFLNCNARTAFADASTFDEARVNEGLRLTSEVFLAAILAGQRQAAVNVIEEALRDGQPLVDVYVDVFAWALHRIGNLWELNLITVAQEHRATSITQYVIASVYPKITSTGPRRRQMTVTGVAGELHQIGANLVADAMETQGWDVSFLGSNLPSTAIVDAVQQNSSNVLCISTTLVANLTTVSELVGSVRTRLGNGAPRIVVGGAAYRLAPNFADDLRVESHASTLRASLAILCN